MTPEKKDTPWMDVHLTKEVMNYLWDIINNPIQPTTDAKGTLAGNISKSEFIKDKDNWFYEKVLKEMSEYLFYKNSSNVYDKSLEAMPEIARAKVAIESADLSIDISKAAFLPLVTASAALSSNYGFNLNLPDGFSNAGFSNQLNENLGYGVGFNVSIPIFNRFQTKNRVAQSVINKEISETRLESEKLSLKQTIEQSFLDVKTALKTFEASKISLEAQEEAFKNAQQRYNFGAMTQFDFDQVRTRLVNAEAALIRSKYDYVFKTKVLQFYAGELVLE
jgi:outer membrane protein